MPKCSLYKTQRANKINAQLVVKNQFYALLCNKKQTEVDLSTSKAHCMFVDSYNRAERQRIIAPSKAVPEALNSDCSNKVNEIEVIFVNEP